MVILKTQKKKKIRKKENLMTTFQTTMKKMISDLKLLNDEVIYYLL